MTYYTPTLEEFHIGFEYEILEDWDTYPERNYLERTWWPQVYGGDGSNPERLGFVDKNTIADIRVKYLDEQDIKDLGWVQDENYPTQYYLKETDFVWTLVEFDDFINIETSSRHVNFNVTIKNKSELKKLMSQLGIII